MLGLRRNSSPTTHLPPHAVLSDRGDSLHHHGIASPSGSSCCGGAAMTGVNAAKSTSEPAGSASPTVWRKTSHPPLHFNNNETRNRNLQLQLRNRGTKDDWGASLRYDIEEPTSSTNLIEFPPDVPVVRKLSRPLVIMDDIDETGSVTSTGSDRTVLSPIAPMSIFDKFLCLTGSLHALVSSIFAESQKTTGAADYAVFLYDEDNKLMCLFNNEKMLLTGRKFPMNFGIVGRVAETKRRMNIRNVPRCPFFEPEIDEQFSVKAQNMLAFPLMDNADQLIGVILLYNKENGFTHYDEQFIKRFSYFAANGVAHAILFKQIEEVQTRIHMVEEFKIQGEDAVIEDSDVMRLVNDPLRDWRYFSQNFADFSFPPRSIGENHFHRASMMFFEDLGFASMFKMNKRKLSFFVLRVSLGYRTVPYHNWSHAFAVTHFCWLSLRTDAIRRALNDMERLSLLIACLCHDIDHRGTTNSFQMQSLQKTPLSVLYSTEGSVLERHHFAQAVKLLQQEQCSILENVPSPDFRTIVNTIREVILATDISAHLRKKDRIKVMIEEGYNPMSFDHRYLLMCLVMTSSDLSDQAKNFHNAKKIAENIYKEFFAQGDLELQLGVKPLEMMDRTNAFVPNVQIDFLKSIGVPVFNLLASVLPEGKATAEAIEANQMCWMALHDEVLNNPHATNDLKYLRDENIERKIYDRVRKHDPRAAELASKRFEPVYANGSVAQTHDILDHRFDGYDKKYQVPCCTSQNTQQIRSLQKVKAAKASEDVALLKPMDNGTTMTSRRSSRTPRRLWRRARQLISSMSSSCASCSPLPSRRQVSEDSESG